MLQLWGLLATFEERLDVLLSHNMSPQTRELLGTLQQRLAAEDPS
ncbi:MAG: hypothetical protein ACI8S6_005188 [Myxococcota bacterium]